MKPVASSQIGGKGSIRRKKKGTGGHIIPKLSEDEKEFNMIIDNLNNSITNIDYEEKNIWNVFFEDWLYDITESLVKKDFNKNKLSEFEKLKNDYKIFYTKFYKDEDNLLLLIKDYKLYKTIFSEQGLDKIFYYLEDLQVILNKKEYLEDQDKNEDDEFSSEKIKEYYNLLELDKSSIPIKPEFKNAYYTKSREYHPDKHSEEVDKYTLLFKEINKAKKFTKINQHFNYQL